MATTTEQRPVDNQHQYVDFDEYVGFHLSRTQSSIKTSEILTCVGWIATLGLSYLFLFTVTDHWLVEGGVSRHVRIGLLLSAVVLSLGWFVWKVAIPYFRRINALYAAREIEQAAPALKGGLVNLVDLQNHQKQVPEHVRVAIEKYAAVELSSVDVDEAVDRGPLMRVSYLLLAVMTLCCMYAMFSPKNILASVKRALLPLSETAAPTQTRITDVDPGSTTAVELDTVAVTAKVAGQVPDAVTLYYSTADRKYVDEPLPMQEQGDGGLPTYSALLAGENGRGLVEDISYYIVAGDDRTETYTITVEKPPSAQIVSLAYAFPPYMESENRRDTSGHINAYEGTEVTITAETNIPVTTAWIEFVDGEPTGETVRLTVKDGTQLTGSWTLELREDGSHAPHYWIQCKTEDGRRDPNPTRYNMVIKPDLDPEVSLLFPKGDVQMPANGIIPLQYAASDPDFKLRYLELIAEKDGTEIFKHHLLDEDQSRQRVEGTYDWKLEPLHLLPGDRLQFFLKATDNKRPNGNETRTSRLNLDIIEPVTEEEAQEQLEQEKQEQQQQQEQESQEREPGDADAEQREPGEGEQDPEDQRGETDEQETAESDQSEPGDEGKQGDASETGDQPGDENGSGGSEPGQDGTGTGEPRERQPQSLEDQEELLKDLVEQDQQNPDMDQEQPQQGDQSDSSAQDQEREKGSDSQGKDPNQDQPKGDDSQKRGDPQDQQQQDPTGKSDQEDQQQRDPAGKSDQKNQQQQQDPAGKSDQKDQQQSPDGKPGEQGEPGGDSPPGESEASANDDPSAEKAKPTDGGDQSEQAPQDGETGKPSKPTDNDDSASGTQEEKPQGEEQPAGDDPNAVKKEATGDETGPAKAADQQDAEKAKKQLDREGEKNEQGRKPGDPDAKPDAAEKGNPDDPDKAKAKPKPGESPEEQPDGPPGEQENKPRDDNQTRPEDKPKNSNEPSKGEGRKDQKSQEPQEGEQGGSTEGDEGAKNKSEPGAGDETQQPGDKSNESQEAKPGEKQQKQGEKGGKGSEEAGDQQAGAPQDGESGKSGGDSKPPSQPPGDASNQQDAPPGAPTDQANGATGGGATPPGDGTEPAPAGPAAGDQPGDAQNKKAPDNADQSNVPEPEAANLEYTKKATELLLNKLRDQLERGDVDEEWMKRRGWTDENLRKAVDNIQERMNSADSIAEDDPASMAERRQFEEMLKDLKVKRQTRKRTSSRQNQQRVRQLDKKRALPPQRFRRRYQEFTRSLSKTQAKETKKTPEKKQP